MGDSSISWEFDVLTNHIQRPEYGYTESASNEKIGPKFLRITDIQDGGVSWDNVPYCKCDPESLKKKQLWPEDLFVARIGATTGKSYYIESVPEDAVFASYLIRLRTNKKTLDPKFLYYFMQTPMYWEHIDRYKGDRLKGGVNIQILEMLPIPLPPISEQKRIVQVLDQVKRSCKSELIQEGTSLNLKQNLLDQILSRGLDGADSKQSDIGLLPKNWKVVPFSKAATIAEGQVDPRVEPYSDMVHVGPENVERDTGKLLDCKTAKELNLISGKYRFRKGDIVYSKIRPYLKKAILARFDGICSADMYPLTPTRDFDPYFLFAFLLSEKFTSQAIPQQDRTGIPKINREQLNSVLVPLPPLEEQKKIAALMQHLDLKIDLHHRKRLILEDLFFEVLTKLMSNSLVLPSDICRSAPYEGMA